jgi:hypothetical protein
MDRREQLYGIAEKRPKVRGDGQSVRPIPFVPPVKIRR